jgi:hypothetical protein
MSIFDFLKDILFLKNKQSLANVDNESAFSPYMVNRWSSMYSNQVALKCNILNKYFAFSPIKTDVFNLFFHFLPRVAQRKITYFKKIKEEKQPDNNNALLAKSLEVSTREIENYTDMLKTLKR